MRTMCLFALAASLMLPAMAPRVADGAPVSDVCCRGGHGGARGGGGRARSYGGPRAYGTPRYRGGAPRSHHPTTGGRAHVMPRAPRAPHAHHTPREYRAPAPRAYHAPRATHHAPPHAPGARDRHGRLKRSEEAKREFMRETGHPHGWPGHVIDHITPLACGGSDTPGNMQWQTIEEGKAKDRVERRGCGK